jgi:hypothetical protein
MTEGMSTMANFNSAGKSGNICYQFYTSSDSFHNYLCLTCCEQREMSKYMHYCRFCMTTCASHHKDHHFVKVAEGTRCVCAYSGGCKSENKPAVCADKIGATLKKEYQCNRCMASLCIVCVDNCLQLHREWVRECKELSFFKCRSKLA